MRDLLYSDTQPSTHLEIIGSPDTLGTPGTGVILSDVNFVGATTSLSVNSDADRVAVNCGSGACTGTWDWSALEVTGGSAGPITNFDGIEDFSQ